MSAQEKIKQLQEEIKSSRTAYTNRAKELFADATKELFEKYPEMESFSWRQYTQYFNDGDECTFHVYHWDDCVGINEDGGWDNGYKKDDWRRKAQDDVSDLLGSIDEEVLKDIYDDHVTVTVYRNGKSETETCEHD